MSKMEHDWYRPNTWSDASCNRCGCWELEHQRGLPASQSIELYAIYWRDGKSHGRVDPGCVERDP